MSNQNAGRRHRHHSSYPPYDPSYSGYPVMSPVMVPRTRVIRNPISYYPFPRIQPVVAPTVVAVPPPSLYSPTLEALSPSIRTVNPFIPQVFPPFFAPMVIPFGTVEKSLLLVIKSKKDDAGDADKKKIDNFKKRIDEFKTKLTTDKADIIRLEGELAGLLATPSTAATAAVDAKKIEIENKKLECVNDEQTVIALEAQLKVLENSFGTDTYYVVLVEKGSDWFGFFSSKLRELKDAVYEDSGKALYFPSAESFSTFQTRTAENLPHQVHTVVIELNKGNAADWNTNIANNMNGKVVYVPLDSITKLPTSDKKQTVSGLSKVDDKATQRNVDLHPLIVNAINTNQNFIKGLTPSPIKFEKHPSDSQVVAWV